MLEEKIRSTLIKHHAELMTKEELFSQQKLNEFYARFQSLFSPEKLSALDGEDLLNTLHLHGNRDSLVYWLEFKDDDEFPAIFGSIAGGSALKFGIYKNKKTGAWMTGAPSSQREITAEDAIAIARKHRDQLVSGSELLRSFPKEGSDSDYVDLQRQLEEKSPDINDTAWGHKYFSLNFPDKLDDYHAVDYQRFHLIKCLIIPPEIDGRYVCAGRYLEIAKQLSIPLNHLTTILNRTNGRPYRVWRIGTRLGEKKESVWQLMLSAQRAIIGWDKLGALSWVIRKQESKDKLRSKLETEYYSGQAALASRKAGEIFNFVATIEVGDLLVAADGDTILGIGRVTGPYKYDPAPDARAPHHRPVEWLDGTEWQLPEKGEGLLTTVSPLKKRPINLVAVEERLLDPHVPHLIDPTPTIEPAGNHPSLTGIPGRIQSILDRKGQVILYGPPGTGKTYWARKAAYELAALSSFGKSFEILTPSERGIIEGDDKGPGQVRVCTFHPNYGYEDFIEGYRPFSSAAGQLVFEKKDGIFKRLCTDAKEDDKRIYVLLIDEINRGDPARIFGELITLLENDKRGYSLHLPISGERYSVPRNVRIIGTMNTADRSIALLDKALRRRFGFIELLPDPAILKGTLLGGRLPLGPWLTALNHRIRKNVGRDARHLQIGHAYLLNEMRPVTDITQFTQILADDIIPLLEEYCYEDYQALVSILGPKLVDKDAQRIREDLFLPERSDELLDALLTLDDEIELSSETVALVDGEEPLDHNDESESSQ